MDESAGNSDQNMDEEESEHESDKEQAFRTGDNEQVLTIESNDNVNSGEQVHELEQNNQETDRTLQGDNRTLEVETIDNDNQGDNDEGYPPPVTGMEYKSYDDAYNYYNAYAKELGFGIRVKSSWTKRNSKEKRGAVLCCNCEGFKNSKEKGSRRKETRTGCQAMIRLRLADSNRWRVDESKLEHNHLFDPQSAINSKSHKRIDSGEKRKSEDGLDVEIHTIKLYRTPVMDSLSHRSSREKENGNPSKGSGSKQLILKKGDTQMLQDYFSLAQLTNPNFFYVMDFNDEGFLRHVFWIDPRARAVYDYFCDVVSIDSTCLLSDYEIPLLSFVGVNHHGESVLLGCALLADDTYDTYIWLLRVWLTCMRGRPPQTVITDNCKSLESAISEVFPRAHHRYSLTLVLYSIFEKLGEILEFEAFQTVLSTLHDLNKVDEFEGAWEEMIQRFGIKDHDWLCSLYEDREKWAPVYLKDTFFAGQNENTGSFFNGYVNKQTLLRDFFDIYESVMQKNYQKEALDDFESRESTSQLKTTSLYELQLSKIYTKNIFLKFQNEVEAMSSCLSVTQVHISGSIVTYMVKDGEGEGEGEGDGEGEGNLNNFEVMYDRACTELRCFCSCFNLRGYLCRHALCVLNYNNVEEVPVQYILSRWRKDFKRLYVTNVGSDCIDSSNAIHWFDHLYKRATGVVEEGMRSQERYTVAWQAFKESLNKVRLVGDKHI